MNYSGVKFSSIPRKGDWINFQGPEIKFRPLCTGTTNKVIPLIHSEVKAQYVLSLATVKSLEDLAKIYHIILAVYPEEKDPYLLEHAKYALRLYLYFRNFGDISELSIRDYWYNSVLRGPSFALWLKKYRQVKVIISLSSRTIVSNDKFINDMLGPNEFDIKTNDSKTGYDSFLNEKYLPHFIEEDDHFSFAFIDVKPTYFYDMFRHAARKLFSEFKSPKILDPRDYYATWISDSVTRKEDGSPILNRKLMRELSTEDRERICKPISRKPTFHLRGISVGPANFRSTWQCELDTLFFVKRMSLISRCILEELPYSAMCSPIKADRRRRKIRSSESSYLMMDYRKCGLTVNRELLIIIYDELDKLYPGKGFSEGSSWKDIIVMKGNTPHSPPRGTGLGNCNEGVTLIQCVLGSIMKDFRGYESIFFNDDGVICLPDDEISHRDFTFFVGLYRSSGMILNLKKTIISRYNVFCEDYFTDDKIDYRKLQNLVIPFANCFFGTISAAKELYYSLSRGLLGRRASVNILASLVRIHGIEFHKSEVEWPFEFGGWSYIGRTSANEILRFVDNPRYYMTSHFDSVQFTLHWIRYLTVYSNTSLELRARFSKRYSKTVKNPFKTEDSGLSCSDFMNESMDKLGGLRMSAKDKNLDDLYNIRGGKFAKPKMRLGLTMRTLYSRRRIWRQFRASLKSNRDAYSMHVPIFKVLAYIRSTEESPSMLVPPDSLFESRRKCSESAKTFGRISVHNPSYTHEVKNLSIINFFESLDTGVWKQYSTLFAGRFVYDLARSRALISDESMNMQTNDMTSPPDWMYLFYPRKEYHFAVDSLINPGTYVYRFYPYEDVDNLFRRIKRPWDYILPERKIRFETLLKQDKTLFEEVWNSILDSIPIVNLESLDIILDSIESILSIGRVRVEHKALESLMEEFSYDDIYSWEDEDEAKKELQMNEDDLLEYEDYLGLSEDDYPLSDLDDPFEFGSRILISSLN